MMKLKIVFTSLLAISLTCAVAHAEQQSATDKVNASLKQIKKSDSIYNAVIAISPTARQEASDFDKNPLGFLNGMPILVKDNIDTLGLPTTAGSLALIENHPSSDSPSIAQIKNAGGIILGKANLSEWANFRSEKSSSGWSAVGGQTRNAHNTQRTPCGSSSGSAVAVALGYVDVAIGTETHGSIVCPASINGVVGFKPTHGIVSGAGIVPLALSQDTAGPIANNIENAARVLAAMIDPKAENYTALSAGLRDLASGRKQLDGLRIGVQSSTLGYDKRRDALFDRALEKLRKAGVVIIENVELKPYDGFWDENYQLLQYEFRRDLNTYFTSRDNSLKSMTLEKLIRFNDEHSEKELKHFDQSIFEKSQTIAISEKDYQTIRDKGHTATRNNGLDPVFKQQNLDAVIGITHGPAWLIDHINGDSFFGPGMSGYPAIGGYPHVTVPGGNIAGMPVGISFVGKRYEDHILANIVYLFTELD